MPRRAWIVLVALLVALFAVVVGGFLWPRPQFRKGPWAPGDSARIGEPPGEPAPGSAPAAPSATAPAGSLP